MTNEFSLLDNILQIVNREDLKDKIAYFKNKNESGYEKWLQHEIAFWLQTHNGHEVNLEWSIDIDKRRSIRDRLLVDLCVNMKSQSNYFLHAVELKVTNQKTAALRQSILDLLRFKISREKNWPFRSVTSIAFANNDDNGKYSNFWSKLKSESKSNWIFSDYKIENTGVSMYVLSWRVPPRNVDKLNFEFFTDFLMQTAKEFEIDTFEIAAEKRRPKIAIMRKIDKSKQNIKRLTAK